MNKNLTFWTCLTSWRTKVFNFLTLENALTGISRLFLDIDWLHLHEKTLLMTSQMCSKVYQEQQEFYNMSKPNKMYHHQKYILRFFFQADAKSTLAYSSDLLFLGTIMQLSALSPKIRELQHWGCKNKIDSDIGPRFVKKYKKVSQ